MWLRAMPAARPALMLLTFAALSCGEPSGSAPVVPAGAAPPITQTDLMMQLGRLADDSMLGRGSGTADEQRTANYIQRQFESWGLQPTTQTFDIAPARVGGRIGVKSQNVIGVLPGNGDLSPEWLVVGAHYDHKGTATVGGSTIIYNGADDNGSGSAALLLLARQLAEYVHSGGAGTVPRRSLMFIAFGAEELGLLGSTYYCAQPAQPLAAVYAMVDFDMIGRMQDTLYVGGTGTAVEWQQLLQQNNSDHLLLGTTECTGCTDFAGFAAAHRPVLWFFTGLHPDYHQPTDDVARINQAAYTSITNLAERLVVQLALTRNALTSR